MNTSGDPAPASPAAQHSHDAEDFRAAVVHLAAEYWPFARSGGLAEAVRGIARYQAMAGLNTLVFMPFYANVREGFPDIEPLGEPFEVTLGGRTERVRIHHAPVTAREPRVHFVACDPLYDRPGLYGEHGESYPDNHVRFAFFCAAVLHALPRISPGPTLIHAHDWHAALAPVYLATEWAEDPYYGRLSTVLTVHNAGYQGHYGPDALAQLGLPGWLYDTEYMEWYGHLNLLKGGLAFSDMVTTVSPTHAHELRTRAGGFGLDDTFNRLSDRFVGILNGIDYDVWNPETDPDIVAPYSRDDLSGKAICKTWIQDNCGLRVDADVPLFAMSARLVEQKGLDIILAADMIPRLDAEWVFLGQGEPRYEDALLELAAKAPERICARFDFSEDREHKLMAAADFLLMPSLYEPCGLTQMRAQRYGALPIVRRVGGLADTVEDRVTGYVFDEYQPWALEEAVRHALVLYRDRTAWREHVRIAMDRDFGWEKPVARYGEVYVRAVAHHVSRHPAAPAA